MDQSVTFLRFLLMPSNLLRSYLFNWEQALILISGFKRYTGDKVKSSMALVNIKLPSGWAAIEESVEKLKESVGVKLFEINENVIVLYFDEVNLINNM